MPTVLPNTERNAGEVRPNSIATRASSSMPSPSPPYSSGIDRPKRPERLHVVDDVGRHLVGLVDLRLERDQPLVDEAADRLQQFGQHFARHGRFPSQSLRTPGRVRPLSAQPSAAMTSGGACTSSISTPSPPIGNCSLPFGCTKQMSCPAAPLRMPPGREAQALLLEPAHGHRQVVDPQADVVERRGVHRGLLRPDRAAASGRPRPRAGPRRARRCPRRRSRAR